MKESVYLAYRYMLHNKIKSVVMMFPSFGVRLQEIRFNNVVLPYPLGAVTATFSPSAISRLLMLKIKLLPG